MYSRIAGTGATSAPAGSQMRAASRQPSGRGIQQCSISRTGLGNAVSTLTACLPGAAGRPSLPADHLGHESAIQRLERPERHREPLADQETHGEIPAVDDREPEPARRHGVHLERSVLVKGDLDARYAGHPSELVHAVGINPVPHPVAPEEHHAVAGTADGVVEAPAPVGIELDDALEPALAAEVDPLVREAQVALDDRRIDRLEVHEP